MGDATNGGEQVQLDPTLDFVAGTIAGMTSLAVGFPFDTVKVRFQSPTIAGKYHSTWNALATIAREERFSGLYKGIMSPMATVALMNGLVFASYRFLMKLQLDNADVVPTLYQIALAGAGSGIISSSPLPLAFFKNLQSSVSYLAEAPQPTLTIHTATPPNPLSHRLITTPTELIKIRQQSLLTQGTTARRVAWQIAQENGVRGLYRGLTATALRDIGYGAYFFAYEATCRWLVAGQGVAGAGSGQLGWPGLMLAGGVAGIAGWAMTFPFDVVKTRIQASQPIYAAHATPVHPLNVVHAHFKTPSPLVAFVEGTVRTPLLGTVRLFSSAGKPKDLNPYRSTWSTIVHSYRTEGLRVFFKGLSPTLIRAVPVNMVTFGTFEAVVRTFG